VQIVQSSSDERRLEMSIQQDFRDTSSVTRIIA
jgi:hypothetical protein